MAHDNYMLEAILGPVHIRNISLLVRLTFSGIVPQEDLSP